MQINPITSFSAAASADTAGRLPQKSLGQGDFLKLLTVQLQQQDPMKPMDDTQAIAQMAQFSSLQQSAELNQSFQAMRLDTQLASAGSLIGRQATIQAADGTIVTGPVEAVEQTPSGPRLFIHGTSHAYEGLVRVSPAPLQATS